MATLNNNYVIRRQVGRGRPDCTVSMGAFWGATGASVAFDPKTLYDPYNNRWLVFGVAEPGSVASSVLLAISDTSDPQGTWHLYKIDM